MAGAFRTELRAGLCVYVHISTCGESGRGCNTAAQPANQPISVAICCGEPLHLSETAADGRSEVRGERNPARGERGGQCREHMPGPLGMPTVYLEARPMEGGRQ